MNMKRRKFHKRDILEIFSTGIPELIFLPVRLLSLLWKGFARLVGTILDAF
ncbi:hypothetical protein [Halobacillus sp. K22]|uniref:hypothetical protein n=1 Tax=Halobacillus sp. K22 TaxID=3457431 RepID=UPI003FCC9564